MASLVYSRSSSASLSNYGRPWSVSTAPKISSTATMVPLGSVNEKEQMQNLNNRLASYLEMVSALEKTNKHLENKIREKLSEEKVGSKDYSKQFELIKTLQKQIADSISENTNLLLTIDNTKLAIDDFRVKWGTECALRQSVEADIGSLVKVKDNHQSLNLGLQTEVDSLQNELLNLQKNHQQELAKLRDSQAKAKVHVEVDAAQGPDLNSILSEIRSQYEDIMKKNKEEADALFQSQSETMCLRLEQEDQASKAAQDELRERRDVLQGLQLELDTLINQVNALKGNVQDTELTIKTELDRLQGRVSQLEQELAETAQSAQNNKMEYEALLRIKETLEAEIIEYRRLLDGDPEPEVKVVIPEPREPDIRTKKIIKIVTQTLVDGKIVGESSEVEEYENAEKSNAI
ncbi:keratin, type I cytoskeletal 18-like [Discoglossus pictus]